MTEILLLFRKNLSLLRTKMGMTCHGQNHSYRDSCIEKKDSPDKSAKHRRREK